VEPACRVPCTGTRTNKTGRALLARVFGADVGQPCSWNPGVPGVCAFLLGAQGISPPDTCTNHAELWTHREDGPRQSLSPLLATLTLRELPARANISPGLPCQGRVSLPHCHRCFATRSYVECTVWSRMRDEVHARQKATPRDSPYFIPSREYLTIFVLLPLRPSRSCISPSSISHSCFSVLHHLALLPCVPGAPQLNPDLPRIRPYRTGLTATVSEASLLLIASRRYTKFALFPTVTTEALLPGRLSLLPPRPPHVSALLYHLPYHPVSHITHFPFSTTDIISQVVQDKVILDDTSEADFSCEDEAGMQIQFLGKPGLALSSRQDSPALPKETDARARYVPP
jgi:hypothetical protein